MKIDLDRFRSSKSAVFAGRERGVAVMNAIGEDKLKESQEIIFEIPNDVFAINSSFILGLLGSTIRHIVANGKKPNEIIRIPEGFELTFEEAFRQAVQTECLL